MNQLYPKIAALSALKNPARQSRALRLGQLHKGIVFVTSVICASHSILEESRTQQQHPQDHPRHWDSLYGTEWDLNRFGHCLSLEQRALPAKPRKYRSQIAKRKMQMVTVMWQHCSSMWFYIMRIMCNVATLGGNIWPQKWCCFPCGLPNPDGPPWIGVSSNWAQGTSEPCPSRCEMHPL